MNFDDKLRPRAGPASKLLEGPKIGGRSLYEQQVLDEDTYTEALSHIITRDFFPNLPHIHATNAYLTALTNNDPELLSSSIRKLAKLAQEKEAKNGESSTRGSKGEEERKAQDARRMELESMGTPYISKPGGSSRGAARTPLGARGWDTPIANDSQNRRNGDSRADGESSEDDEDLQTDLQTEDGGIVGQSRPRKKRRKTQPRKPIVRDDLTLDTFQRNFTSEDNASFAQIVDSENQARREERWKWAWEAEKRANQRRVEGEERRKMILDIATSGNWRVNAEGRRLIGGLAEGGAEKMEGEAWKDKKLITADSANSEMESPSDVKAREGESSLALVQHTSSTSSSALINNQDAASSQSKIDTSRIREEPISINHPLGRALVEVGLPNTAMMSKEDGALVPMSDIGSGSQSGRGRGSEDQRSRDEMEQAVMGDEEQEHLAFAGSGGDQWGYKTRNNFYFSADANTDPYPRGKNASLKPESKREAPPSISHSNTRLPDEDEVGPASRDTNRSSSSRRGSSPARSWVQAAVKGTPYHPSRSTDDEEEDGSLPKINNYPLLPNNPSPSPENLPSLLTWGTLLATPKALDGGDDPLDNTRSFRLPQMKRRDELGRKLGNKASRDMNERAQSYTPRTASGRNSLSDTLKNAADRTRSSNGKTPMTSNAQMLPPSSTPKRSDHLTPAGKRLLERSLGRSPMANSGSIIRGAGSKNRGAAMEKGSGWGDLGGPKLKKVGEMSWTPSPAHKR